MTMFHCTISCCHRDTIVRYTDAADAVLMMRGQLNASGTMVLYFRRRDAMRLSMTAHR